MVEKGERQRVLALALVLAALVAVGCGDDDDDGGSSGSGAGGQQQFVIVRRRVDDGGARGVRARLWRGRGFRPGVPARRLGRAGGPDSSGVKPDVFAAANTKLPDELYEEDLVEQPVEFATNEFVLAVPADSDIKSVADLTDSGTKIAIGSESAPIGPIRARRWRSRPRTGEGDSRHRPVERA